MLGVSVLSHGAVDGTCHASECAPSDEHARDFGERVNDKSTEKEAGNRGEHRVVAPSHDSGLSGSL